MYHVDWSVFRLLYDPATGAQAVNDHVLLVMNPVRVESVVHLRRSLGKEPSHFEDRLENLKEDID